MLPTSRIEWRDGTAMAALLFVALGLVWGFGELIPVGKGFGFGDGRTYGRLGMSFSEFEYIDVYRMGRVLPSMAVNAVHSLLPGDATAGMTVRLFRLMNVSMLLGSVGLWYLIARSWSLSRAAAWIGFVGLFVNFSNLKFSLYYPTLTDTAAFAFGMLLLYAFLTRQTWLSGGVALAAAFISPPLAVFAVVLFLLPRLDTEPVAHPSPRHISLFGSAAAVLAGLGISWKLWELDSVFDGWIVTGGEPTWQGWLWLSITVVAVYFALGVRPLAMSFAAAGGEWARKVFTTRTNLASLLWRIGALGIAVVIVRNVYQLGAEVTARDTDILFDRMIYSSVARPLAFLVGHVAHFGPIIILAVLLWPQVARLIHRLGPGMVLLFAGILVLSLTSESRTITAILPFVAAFAAAAADRLQWRTWHVGFFAAASLIVSRVWFTINRGVIEDAPILEFPAQYYFMNFGPWMSNRSYWVFAAGMGAVTVLVTLLVFNARKLGSSPVTVDGDPT